MVSTIYSVTINSLNDDFMEVRCSFSNFKNAFSFAKEIAIKRCETGDFFVQDSDGFTLYDEYKVPFCIVCVKPNDLFA